MTGGASRGRPALLAGLALLMAAVPAVTARAWAGPGSGTITGSVFADENADGRRGAEEPGLPGVAVSNGRDVVLTDATGTYVLPAGDAMVFVIKPAGFRLPETADHRPQFFFTPAAPGASGRDFPLLRGADGERFSVLVLADPQINDAFTAGLLNRSIVEPLVGSTRYRFGLTLGDIVWDDLTLFSTAAAILGRVGIPWFHTIGNHDVDMSAAAPRFADDVFEQSFGPSHYAFNEGRVHFLILNSIRLGPGKPKLDYRGGLTERQFEFIERNLAQVPLDRLVVVALHHPLYSTKRVDAALAPADRTRLFKLLGRFPRTLSLSGHSHVQSRWRFGAQDGWPGPVPHEHYNVGTACGDWWAGNRDRAGIPDAMMRDGTPKGYASLHFDGPSYRIEYVPADPAIPPRFHIHGPPEVSAAAAPSFVYVNYYLGSADTRVEFRRADGMWQAFERTWEPDPRRVQKFEAWVPEPKTIAGARPSKPLPSTHLWKAILPRDGPAGPRLLEIRILTEEGEELLASHEYRVVP